MRRHRRRIGVLRLATWLAIGTSVGCNASDVGVACRSNAPIPSGRPLVGAIRFDFWQPGPIGDTNIAQLGPKQWRYRLPFYGVEVDSNTVSLAENTQAIMDREIAYAHAAGLDFFCFNHFLTERAGLNLYLSSTRKRDINFCLQMGALFPGRVADAVNLMKTEPTYQKVAGGRPLVFLQAWYLNGFNPPEERATVDGLRAQAMQAGLPNPYIVVENFDPAQAVADAEKYGADAISSYSMGLIGGKPGVNQPFSQLSQSTEQDWDIFKKTGKKVVPTIMTGFDVRPVPTRTGEAYWAEATPQEIANQVQAALKWVDANPCVAEAHTIQIYAWNEITEGGWLLPSNTAFNPVGTGRLDAIGAVMRADSVARSKAAATAATASSCQGKSAAQSPGC